MLVWLEDEDGGGFPTPHPRLGTSDSNGEMCTEDRGRGCNWWEGERAVRWEACGLWSLTRPLNRYLGA